MSDKVLAAREQFWQPRVVAGSQELWLQQLNIECTVPSFTPEGFFGCLKVWHTSRSIG